MIGFIKRRWLLLSCAAVIAACSMIDSTIVLWAPHTHLCYLGTESGHIGIGQRSNSPQLRKLLAETPIGFHPPMMGSTPEWRLGDGYKNLTLPIWVPLSVVLGWLVICELRWRERRAKASD